MAAERWRRARVARRVPQSYRWETRHGISRSSPRVCSAVRIAASQPSEAALDAGALVLAQRRARGAHPRALARLGFTPLEPRLLLNADVLAVNLTHDLGAPPVDHALLVELVHQTETVDAQTVTVQRIQIVDQNNGDAVLAFGDISAKSRPSRSTIRGAGSRQDHNRRQLVRGRSPRRKSRSTARSGQNTVVFDNAPATQWSSTGANSGRGQGRRDRSHLQGRRQPDRRREQPGHADGREGGALSGVFDGGAGGGNALSFDNGVARQCRQLRRPQLATRSRSTASRSLSQRAVGGSSATPRSYDLSGLTNSHFEVGRQHPDRSTTSAISGTPTTNFGADGRNGFRAEARHRRTLKVDALNFNPSPANSALNIDGAAVPSSSPAMSRIRRALSASVNATDTRRAINQRHRLGLPVGAGRSRGSITLDAGFTISASTISLSALPARPRRSPTPTHRPRRSSPAPRSRRPTARRSHQRDVERDRRRLHHRHDECRRHCREPRRPAAARGDRHRP